MSSKGRSTKLVNGLTPKQNKFVREVTKQVAQGKAINLTEAALNSYDTTDRETAGTIGESNMKKVAVRESLKEILQDIGMSNDKIVRNISKIANKEIEKTSSDTMLKANLELLKLSGMYPNARTGGIQVNFNQQINNMSYTEAQEKLKELQNGNTGFMTDGKIDEPVL